MSLAVEFRDVVKNFGPVQVLHGVSFSIAPGRVLGLIGENGAGKSTLMKILVGLCGAQRRRDPGGRQAPALSQFARSRSAGDRAHPPGIQPGRRPDHRPEHLPRPREDPRLDPRRGRDARASRPTCCARSGWMPSPDTRVRDLIVAEKQLVEIAKALARKARLLIMDEPTATLTPGETAAPVRADGAAQGRGRHPRLHLAQAGRSRARHRRSDRDARRALRHRASPRSRLTRHDMANLMVGRELSDLFPAKEPAPQADAGPACARLHRAGLGAGHRLRSEARRNPRLRRPGRRGPHRAVRRPARPARRQSAKWRWPASRCGCATRAKRPTKASPT